MKIEERTASVNERITSLGAIKRHLMARYGARAQGKVPWPDCDLCAVFCADLPVTTITGWMAAGDDASMLDLVHTLTEFQPSPQP